MKKINNSKIYKNICSIGLLIVVSTLILTQSCQSNSKSGKAKLIATVMAKKEANKKSTIPTPETIKKDVDPEVVEIDDVVTPKEKNKIKNELINNKIPPAQGKLIQVEGLVLREVNKLTIDLKTSSSQLEQIFAMNDYVYSKWHYVFDPSLNKDTWRSAEATISLKYKGIYSGDCDDFAILMASFARQIGLEARIVAAFDDNGNGHAFSEILVPENDFSNPLLNSKDYRVDDQGKWISLDWFKGKSHYKYKNNLKIFDDI
ncbi:transglutaminase-like domain-containing protein [uncultured Dokdonia sp.]|uniref:transglutaminase-like domain-containing protein n=1 Tax=uncultured Dokdonia sp. TaxID=575653 RepID=UPI002621F117|nr:transglutaminase-like domain-containing protein [uncultured Dokdonia sp.]